MDKLDYTIIKAFCSVKQPQPHHTKKSKKENIQSKAKTQMKTGRLNCNLITVRGLNFCLSPYNGIPKTVYFIIETYLAHSSQGWEVQDQGAAYDEGLLAMS